METTQRTRGRPPTSPLDAWRTAHFFGMLKKVSGLSTGGLEHAYLLAHSRQSTRKPDAFPRYVKGLQIPKSAVTGRGPVAWALSCYPELECEYSTLVFDIIAKWSSPREVVDFNHDRRHRRAHTGMLDGRCISEPLKYLVPNSIESIELQSFENFSHPMNFDALGVLLVRFKASLGGRSEASWRSLIRDWLVHWIDANPGSPYAHFWMLVTLQSVEPALLDLLGPQGIDRCSEVHADISAKRKFCAAAPG